MDPRALFETWAPPASIWTPWAKPVLFAHMNKVRLIPPGNPGSPNPDVSWAPTAGTGVAIVADLPGDAAVHLGMALAVRGYRPVPLYNTTPGPPPVVVEVGPTMWALSNYAEQLASLRLHDDSPPVFLLDSLRLRSSGSRTEGAFDNRWAVFEQDFPSGTFLLSRRIHEVLLVSPNGGVGTDLARVLSSWRRRGLNLKVRAAAGAAQIEPLTPRKMLSWRLAGYFALLALGLRRNSAGGFGSRIPVSSSGGYG
jgi:hypothetical protein